MTNLEKISKMPAKQLSKIIKWDCERCIHKKGSFDCDAAGIGCADGCQRWLESKTR